MSVQTVGVCGEYFTAGELSLRGYIANITLRNAHAVDILVTRDDNPGKSIGIQVKSKSDEKAVWILNAKSENIVDDKLFYILVRNLQIGNIPIYHIVPRQAGAGDA